MAGAVKQTTGLVGLAVRAKPHDTLKGIYKKVLGVLGNMPEDAAYRQYTEEMIKERLEHVKTEPDVSKLESKIDCGQIEEVVLQAQAELSLARKMLEWKAWEPLIEDAPEGQWKWP
ncbi:NADH dehydrogenase [ubiquinone] 1 alpha subcomplex subunit 5-like [Anneissia japonica]|uniref:NADH dehydrogenase [ubiquinone] 1 alpha subcomplex subunit 5-like n=1 Tax=Anneissia japonica TaxID=1529436 RepID=UPI00142582F5|nr:NADH dehydrogenase [ubiquinone] 1 alpha subcomplex subunit 5-like [Anneissia japonica]